MTLRRPAAFGGAIHCLAGLLLLVLTGEASADPKGPDASAARLMIQDGHNGAIQCVAFSPNGKLVVTGGMDATARLWDVQTGKQVHVFRGHAGGIQSICFSPDGKRVLTGSLDRTARLWDVQTGKQIQSLEGHAEAVSSVAFNFDGNRMLTGGWDRKAALWDVESGKQLQLFEGHNLGVSSVAFSPNDQLVLTGSWDGTGRLWDAQTGKELHLLQGHNLGVSMAIFSPNGKRVLTRSDEQARFWDVETGKFLHKLGGGGWASVAFSPDGKLLLTGNSDGTVILLHGETGLRVRGLGQHAAQVSSTCFSHDGKRVLSGSQDLTARLWDVQTEKLLHIFEGHRQMLSCTAFSPDDKVALTASRDGTARLWDAQTGKLLHNLQGRTDALSSVAFSPDGKRVLTGSRDQTARLWDLQTGQQSHTLQGHAGVVSSVAFSPNGKLALTGSHDQTARLWDVQTGKESHSLRGHTDEVFCVAFSPDGKLALTGGLDQTARMWDVQAGKQIHDFQGQKGHVFSGCFSPDGKLVLTASTDQTARLWDVKTGELLRTIEAHRNRVLCAAFSPDGKLAITGSLDKTARLWDVKTGEVLRTLEAHRNRVSSAAFSPDGKIVLTGGGDKTARLWDAKTGELLRTLEGHTQVVTSTCFSPDGKFVLTGSGDKTARLWDAETAKELCRLVSFSDGTWAVVDPLGRYDASNGGDVQGLHWVVGLEPIALNQLKERYYDPGLLAKHLGFNKEPLREVVGLANPKLYPEVQVNEPTRDNTKLTIVVTNRGGGIGRIVVNLNGKEIRADARPEKTDPNLAALKLEIDLRGEPLLKPGGQNVIEVQAFNNEGYLRSRGMQRLFEADGKEEKEDPHLWAVVAGVSKYSNASLDLRYAAKDAEDFAAALQVASTRLFGADKVHRALLTTAQKEADLQPRRANLVKALEAAQKARPGDVLIIYLAGHGVNYGGRDGDFFYLTCDAASANLEDPGVRGQTTLSSAELTELLKKIPAQKQVLILDTCASGKAVEKLTEKRDVPGSQVRALERVKDRTGLHILAGCAADAVSYEATRYGQGVLTYSLLEGMRGAKLREREYVDVLELFGFAADRVPELARDIGGVQRPVIASPRGGSFDIGRVTSADQKRIPFQQARPQVVRSLFQDEEAFTDVLGLSECIDERLRDSANRGRNAPLVFIDVRKLPDSYQAAGRYRTEKDKVTVTLRLARGDDKGEPFTVQGDKAKLDELAARIVTEIEKRLAGQ
jgi:WD40 repeat protein